MSLRQAGHGAFSTIDGGVVPKRSMSAWVGFNTKKKITVAVMRKVMIALTKSPY
jgi:hypothetical protein